MVGVDPIRNDFPDWGSVASFLTFNPVNITVNVASFDLATFDMSNYQYGMVYVSRDNTNIQNDFAFRWLGTVGAESSVLASSRFTVIDGGQVVIPFQVMTPTLQISDVDASAYPYTAGIGLTLFTNPPYQHGYPGGIFAINQQVFVASTDTVNVIPDGCGPGQHSLSIDTGSTDWDLTLLVYPRRNGSITEVLATSQSGPIFNTGFIVPATQWVIQITNNDVDYDFNVMVARTPNPT